MIQNVDACMILCGCWAVWTEHNARRHGERGKSTTTSVLWVIDTTTDLALTGEGLRHKPRKVQPIWKPSEVSETKINVDASYSESGATGLV